MRHVALPPRTARGAALSVALTLLAACDRPQPTELTLPAQASDAKNGNTGGGVTGSATPTLVVGGLTNRAG